MKNQSSKPRQKNYSILFVYESPDGLQYIGAAAAQRKRSDLAVVVRMFNNNWRLRRKNRSPLQRAMHGTRREDWRISIIETVPKGSARLRKTQLIAERRTTEPLGLNAMNGFRMVSMPARIRASRRSLGVKNPRYVPVADQTICEVISQTTWNSAVKVLGLGYGTISRRLRGEFGKGKYA